MRVGVLTPVRLLGEGLAAALTQADPAMCVCVVRDLAELTSLLSGAAPPEVMLVDVTLTIDLENVRNFHIAQPGLPLLALGLQESSAEIVAHGRAGFCGYVSRQDGVDRLRSKLEDAREGRFACPPEIANGIMRSLFAPVTKPTFDLTALTVRETHVARLLARGLSNKEISRLLTVSESTVKQHVHNILAKTGLSRRAEVMRGIRDEPWQPAHPAE